MGIDGLGRRIQFYGIHVDENYKIRVDFVSD